MKKLTQVAKQQKVLSTSEAWEVQLTFKWRDYLPHKALAGSELGTG